MKKIVGLSLGIACLAAAFSAQATTSAELVVRGTIKPAACNLSLAGSGIIDYGTIRSGELSQTAFNPREERTTSLFVNCGTTPAQVGVSFRDLQAGSKVPGVLGTGFSETQNFGLGTVRNRRTGGYSITLKDLRSSGVVLQPIMRTGSGLSAGPWQFSDGKVVQSNQYSWRSGAAFTPAAISQMTGTIAVRAVINRGQDLDLSQDITIDGRATIVLNYT